MEQKPSPNKLTDEELLELSIQNESKQVFQDDVYLFISTFNLEIGSNRVSCDFLFSIYNKWSKKRSNRDLFISRLKEVFAHDVIDKKLFMLIDSSVAIITKTMVDLDNSFVHKNAGMNTHVQQFVKKYDVTNAKTWVGETDILKLYREWCSKMNKKSAKREDILDALSVLFVNRFNKKNLKEFALTYKIKEGIEEETSPK